MPDTSFSHHAPASTPAPARTLSLTFSGTGAEYFRIWIVNLLLTIVTLGIYSAWAKVRRLQYFDRNTALDGAAFDFNGDPVAILKGRIVALILVAAYQFAFGLSFTAGLVVFGALVLLLPYLLRGALRFRLHHTYWRGLRFAFTGSSQGAFAAFVPPMLIVMAPGLLGAWLARSGPRAPSPWIGVLGLLYLAWPVVHAAIKRYQHAHIEYGGVASTYTLPTRRFWRPYLVAFGIAVAMGSVMALCIAGAVKWPPAAGATHLVAFAPVVLAYLGLLAIFPYLQARVGNLAWTHTGFPGVEIVSDMTFVGLLKLHATNTVLTVLTLGLFRPFAAVRVQRYLLAHLHISASIDIGELIGAHDSHGENAVGEGAADFLGIDFAL